MTRPGSGAEQRFVAHGAANDEALASYGKALECNPGRLALCSTAQPSAQIERYGEAFAP